jgi:hypothetical protein
MSKPIDKKSTLALNSTAVNAKDISHGNLSHMLPKETGLLDEVNVAIEIQDIRYGSRSVQQPEITTLINGNKTVVKIPFTSPLSYHFKRVEDDMIFKFAVTSAGDLLGFIYMEIPHKFKSMKSFKLDDWFPIKHLETEELENLKYENFVARIVVNYKATRKLDGTTQFTGKLPKNLLYEEMAKNLKTRINEINDAVDQFNDEGFKHLATFERKLIKKKIRANALDNDPKKNTPRNFTPTRYINVQKDQFYKTRTALADTQEIKGGDLKPEILYKEDPKKTTHGIGIAKGCQQCEKLLKELSYSRNEIIELGQRLTALEEGQMTVDNVQLKRKLEKELEELSKDKKEYSLRLKESNEQLNKDRQRLMSEFQKESDKTLKQREEFEGLNKEYKALMAGLKAEQDQLAQEKVSFQNRLREFGVHEKYLADEKSKLTKDRQSLQEKEDELKEIKTRMMKERQRILEEGGKYQHVKGKADIKERQLKTIEDFLNEEKVEFQKEIEKRNHELDDLRKELEQKASLYELNLKNVNEEKEELRRKNQDLLEERRKLKMQDVRLWRDKAKNESNIDEILHEKKALEAEKVMQADELNKDYEYIDEQLHLIEKQKWEFEALKDKLETLERHLNDQQRLQHEQQQKFLIAQRNFFEKLKNSEFDIDELKRMANKIGVDLQDNDQRFQENLRLARRIEKGKAELKKSLQELADMQQKEGTVHERRTTNLERKNTRTKDGSVVSLVHADNLKVRKEAADLIDEIFSHVVLKSAKHFDKNKDELIKKLNERVNTLEHKLKDEEAKVKKLKLSQYTEPRASESKVIQNPFHNMDENLKRQSVVVHGAQSPIPPSNSPNNQPAIHQPEKIGLQTLKEEVEDLCDAAILLLEKKLQSSKNAEVTKERIKYLQNGKRVVGNLFKVLAQFEGEGAENKEVNIPAFNLDNDQFDFEKLKARYEAKIRNLAEYIQRIRDNSDFFNSNIDVDILK